VAADREGRDEFVALTSDLVASGREALRDVIFCTNTDESGAGEKAV